VLLSSQTVDRLVVFGQEEILDREWEVIRRMQEKDGHRESRLLKEQETYQTVVTSRQKELDDMHEKRIHDLKKSHQEIEESMANTFSAESTG